jgi:hypothetical protein
VPCIFAWRVGVCFDLRLWCLCTGVLYRALGFVWLSVLSLISPLGTLEVSISYRSPLVAILIFFFFFFFWVRTPCLVSICAKYDVTCSLPHSCRGQPLFTFPMLWHSLSSEGEAEEVSRGCRWLTLMYQPPLRGPLDKLLTPLYIFFITFCSPHQAHLQQRGLLPIHL